MARCNLDLMVQFSCEQLREKRARAISLIADDQELLWRLDAQIRSNEITIANRRAEIARLRGEPPRPGLPGPVQDDGNRRRKRPRPEDIIGAGAEEILRQRRNRATIADLEAEIEDLEGRIRDLRIDRDRRIDRLNEARDGRRCIQDAMWRKGC